MTETIICEKCGAEVIKRSVNHKLCMNCAYKHVEERVQDLYKLDMRNEEVLHSMKKHENKKERQYQRNKEKQIH